MQDEIGLDDVRFYRRKMRIGVELRIACRRADLDAHGRRLDHAVLAVKPLDMQLTAPPAFNLDVRYSIHAGVAMEPLLENRTTVGDSDNAGRDIADTADIGNVEQAPKVEGRQMGMLLGPTRKK